MADGREDAGFDGSPGWLRLGLAAAGLALAVACSGGGGGGEPITGCPAPEARAEVVPDGSVAAGQNYLVTPRFPAHPCRVGRTECVWVIPLPWPVPVEVCTTEYVQGSCLPRLTLIQSPEEALSLDGRVQWSPLRAHEGGTFRFEVETQYPAGCVQQRAAWNVAVSEGPPPPVLRSVTLDRTDVRAGERVTAVADFTGGTGSWDFGLLEPGVPATSPPLHYDWTLHFRVEGGVWEVAAEERTVRVWEPLAIDFFTAERDVLYAAETVELRWGTRNASEVTVTPAPDWTSIGFARVTVRETTTYTLTAVNPLGDRVTAQRTIVLVPPPVIDAFAAVPAATAVGGAPALHASFANGSGVVEVWRGAAGWTRLGVEQLGPVLDGVPFVPPPQRGHDRYRLVVSDGLGRQATAEVSVPVTGPGSFALLPLGMERSNGPLLVPLADGGLLLLGGAASQDEVLDLAAGTVASAAFPSNVRSAVALEDGRVVVSEMPGWGIGGTGPFWYWEAPLAVVDPSPGGAQSWIAPSDPSVAALLFGAWLVPLGGSRLLAISIETPAAAVRIDVDAGTFEPVANAGGAALLGPACPLADGGALLAGGRDRYDVSANAVMPVPGAVAERVLGPLVCLADGAALGVEQAQDGAPGSADRLHRLDPVTGTWSVLADGRPALRAGVELEGGRVLLLDPTEGWVADLATGALERSGRLALPRETYTWPALVRLAGGEVVAHGLGAPYPERFTP